MTLSHLLALDPRTGRELWENKSVPESYGTPLAAKLEGIDVLVMPSGQLVRLADGRLLATVETVWAEGQRRRTVLGLEAGAVFAGIKASNKGREDMALVASEVPAVAAGVFTTNRVQAAPVRVSKAHIRAKLARGVAAISRCR